MGKETLGLIEKVTVYGNDGRKAEVYALMDTGASTTSIDIKLASKLRLGPIVGYVKVKSKTNIGSDEVIRVAVPLELEIKGQRIKVPKANLAVRENMSTLMLIGRDVLLNRFVVDVSLTHETIEAKNGLKNKNLIEQLKKVDVVEE
ncbi:MAG: hypothetical protein GXN99_03460 [Candidatus Nanohaloarchaeota archaeon]|nr:hypothetical protein [Candidatus Nanohaloarchaeota archaeon]